MSSKIKMLIPVLVLALAVVSCNLPFSVSVEPTPQPTLFDLAATLTALAPPADSSTEAPEPTQEEEAAPTDAGGEDGAAPAQSTKTKVPVVQITPIQGLTPVRRPTATRRPSDNQPGGSVPAGAVRINFATGATEATRDGTVTSGNMREYVVRALAGQIMKVGVFTPDQNAVLSVYVPATGQVFLSKTQGLTDWQGRLPATTDYVLRVTGTGGTATYNLQVTVMEVIQFAPGAISATRSYPIAARDVHTFSLRALAGQTMTATITSPDGDVLLAIYGFQDGQPYKRYEVGDPTYTFELPRTQDYVIQAVSVRDSATTFKLVVKVE